MQVQKIIHFYMSNRLLTKFKCEYDEKHTLYYGAFRNEKFEWYLQRNDSLDIVEQLFPANPKASDSSKIFRVSGIQGRKVRFTAQKIKRLATPHVEQLDVFCSKFVPIP